MKNFQPLPLWFAFQLSEDMRGCAEFFQIPQKILNLSLRNVGIYREIIGSVLKPISGIDAWGSNQEEQQKHCGGAQEEHGMTCPLAM